RSRIGPRWRCDRRSDRSIHRKQRLARQGGRVQFVRANRSRLAHRMPGRSGHRDGTSPAETEGDSGIELIVALATVHIQMFWTAPIAAAIAAWIVWYWVRLGGPHV